MNRRAHPINGWIAIALVAAATSIGEAAEVTAKLSQRETYVGLPIALQIQISDASEHEMPPLPDLDGLSIQSAAAPSRSSRISIINGRRSESSSITYSFRITPRREGNFTIPPITVRADGDNYQTPEQHFTASKSETGDLLFVEIVGNQDSIYVGEAAELTLKIWLRPFRDPERGVVLSEGDMWNLIAEDTNWGPFENRLKQLAEENKRVGGQEVLRSDSEGKQRSYYLYEIDATIYPQRPGTIDGDDVQLVVQYPTELGRSRDPFSSFFSDDSMPFRSQLFDDDFFPSPFGSRLSVKSVRPIVAETNVKPIEVKPIPREGRPADYRGAVGQYRIVTEARPITVKAGDPITLNIGVSGSGPMDLVQAPPLADLPSLAKDFKVPDEPLAGLVDGAQKLFTTSIRPRRQGISEIPAIPLSYFDPDQEKFVTVYSDPIAIDVDAAETLQLSNVVVGKEASGSPQTSNFDATESADLWENDSSADVLQSQSLPPQTVSAPLPWLLAPPLVVLATWLFRIRNQIVGWPRLFRAPARSVRLEIAAATDRRQVALALTTYLQRRFSKTRTSTTSDAAIGRLRTTGHRDLAVRFERLFDQCHRDAFTLQQQGLDDLKNQALALVQETEQRSGIRRRVVPLNGQRGPTTATLFLLAASLPSANVATARDREVPVASLSKPHSVILLSEATQLYDQSLASKQQAPAESQQLARRAAEKYQLIVGSGVRNGSLYFNLANAYQLSGQTGRAIANYHRAVRIDPTNQRFRAKLEFAQQSIAAPKTKSPAAFSVIGMLKTAHAIVNRYVDLPTLGLAAIAAWIAVWSFVLLRLLQLPLPWKTLTTTALLVFALTSAAYCYGVVQYRSDHSGVLINPTIELREGDGESFAAVARIDAAAGQLVQVLYRRGDWIQVQTDSGQHGWIPSDQIEIL